MMLDHLPEFLLKLTLWLGAVWLVHFFLGQSRPQWRVALWRLAILAAVALLPLFLWLPRIPISVPDRGLKILQPLAENSSSTPAVPASGGIRPAPKPGPTAVPTSDEASRRWQIKDGLSGIYFTVLALLLIRLVIAKIHVNRLIGRARATSRETEELLGEVARDFSLSGRVQAKISSEISSPVLAGGAYCLLPEGLDPGDKRRLQVIFAHELAHLKAHDPVWSLLIRLLQCTLWFHPLGWRIGSVHSRACEEVADGLAARYVRDISYYGDTLASLAVKAHFWHIKGATLPMARMESVAARLKNLPRNALQRHLGKGALLGFAAGVFGCLIFWALVHLTHSRVDHLPGTAPAFPLAQTIKGTILGPDGKPAEKVGVGIALEGDIVQVFFGDGFSQQPARPLISTDKNGAFELPNLTGRGVLFASGSEGFGEAPLSDKPAPIQLKPWGSISGRYAPGGQSAGKRYVWTAYSSEGPGMPQINFRSHTLTADDGRFVLPGIPAGINRLFVKFDTDPVSFGWASVTNVEVDWGKRTQANLDRTRATVKGRVKIPQNVATFLDFSRNASEIVEVKSTYDTLASQYGVSFGPDGIFETKGIPPGKYCLSVQVGWKNWESLFSEVTSIPFEILPDQAEINLGNITAEVGPIPLQLGQLAPNFDLAASGGGRVKSSDYLGKVLVVQFTAIPVGRPSAENRDFFLWVKQAAGNTDQVAYLSFVAAGSEKIFLEQYPREADAFWQTCYIGQLEHSELARAFFPTNLYRASSTPLEVVLAPDGTIAYLGQNYGEASQVVIHELSMSGRAAKALQ